MRFATLFTALSTLLTIAGAVPVAHDAPTPTPSKPTIPSSSASHAHSHSATPTPVGAYMCPPKQFKQCCQSLQQTSQDVMKGLGEIVPILGGIQISSQISFQCKNMTPDEAPDSCKDHGYAPMCCSNDPSGSVGACKPFAEVKEDYYRTFGYGEESQVDVINEAVP